MAHAMKARDQHYQADKKGMSVCGSIPWLARGKGTASHQYDRNRRIMMIESDPVDVWLTGQVSWSV